MYQNCEKTSDEDGVCPTPPCNYQLVKGIRTTYICEKCGDIVKK